jgi:hypothetical protein
MSVTFDFQILPLTEVPGISLVMPQNEDAFSYLTEEAEMTTFADGSAPVSYDRLSRFVADAERCHLASTFVA